MGVNKVLKAIRAECLTCVDGHYSLVKGCQAENSCLLWPYRMGDLPEKDDMGPLEAVRQHCLECAGSLQGVYACGVVKFNGKPCSLHPFRLGSEPLRRRKGKKAPDSQGSFEGFELD